MSDFAHVLRRRYRVGITSVLRRCGIGTGAGGDHQRGAKLGGVVAVGLSIGLVLGWSLWGRAPDVPSRVAEILETNCLPYVARGELSVTGLADLNTGSLLEFVDARTALLVSFSERQGGMRSCDIADTFVQVAPEDWAVVFAEGQRVWRTRIAQIDGVPPVLVDLGPEGVADPFFMLRPRGREGHYLRLVTFASDRPETTVTFGYAKFNAAIAQEEML